MDNIQAYERYINFYTDFAFKKLFGTEANKDLLISFLNALFDGQEMIKDITYLSTEHLSDTPSERKAVFDIYCENENGDKFLIEMQKATQEYFKDRSIYYSTFPIREQAKQGDWNYQLKRVYAIGILNFTFDDKKSYITKAQICNTETKEVFYEKLTYIFLEMPKFNKEINELSTFFEKWLYAIKYLDKLDERPKFLQEKIFEKFFEMAEIAKFSAAERKDYEQSIKNYRDWYSIIETQRKEGIEKVAKKMKSKNYDINEIIEITGLSESEIEKL